MRLTPTGGVNLENTGEFIRAGACFVGVGSALVDKKLVTGKKWEELSALAAKYDERYKQPENKEELMQMEKDLRASARPTAEKNRVNSVGKALLIMEAIYQAQRSLSIKELATELGMHKSTLHHLVSTLTEFGFLTQDPETRKYNIGLHLVEIGQAYLQQLDVRSIAHPFLERLAMEVGETAHLLILDRNDVVYIDKVEDLSQPTALRCSSYIGRRAAAYATAAGKTLLAHLPEADLRKYLAYQRITGQTPYTMPIAQLLKELHRVKKHGFALDRQENEVGLQCGSAHL